MHALMCRKAKKKIAIRTLTIRSELPPLEMAVPLSPTREGRVWDIQLVTIAIVLSTAPIFSMGTLMSASCGALQPAQSCPLMNLGSRQPGHQTSLSDPTTAPAAAQPPRAGEGQLQESGSTGSVTGTLGVWFEESRSHPAALRWNLPSQSDCLLLTLPPPFPVLLSPSLSLFPALSKDAELSTGHLDLTDQSLQFYNLINSPLFPSLSKF